jgi:hypothetical protein
MDCCISLRSHPPSQKQRASSQVHNLNVTEEEASLNSGGTVQATRQCRAQRLMTTAVDPDDGC